MITAPYLFIQWYKESIRPDSGRTDWDGCQYTLKRVKNTFIFLRFLAPVFPEMFAIPAETMISLPTEIGVGEARPVFGYCPKVTY